MRLIEQELASARQEKDRLEISLHQQIATLEGDNHSKIDKYVSKVSILETQLQAAESKFRITMEESLQIKKEFSEVEIRAKQALQL